jgi:hypothetical protein
VEERAWHRVRQLTGEVKGMKESYSEEPATHAGPESCVSAREGRGEALTGVRIGRVSSLEIGATGRPTSYGVRKATWMRAYVALNRPAWRIHSPGVLDPVHVRNHLARELGDLMVDCTGPAGRCGPRRESRRSTASMHDHEKSDECVVPKKRPNNERATARSAEDVEGRRSTEGNSTEVTKVRPQRRVCLAT